jgi:hypothetical protein
MMRRYVPLLLAVNLGCAVLVKSYRPEPCLPDGEPVGFGYRLPASAVVSLAGLDLTVTGKADLIAGWFAPLFVPVLPLPAGQWDPSGNLSVKIIFQSYRDGWTFSPYLVRLRIPGREPVGPSAWESSPFAAPPAVKVEIRGAVWVDLQFRVSSPLPERAELLLEGLDSDGVAVELPILFLQPSYAVEMLPAL